MRFKIVRCLKFLHCTFLLLSATSVGEQIELNLAYVDKGNQGFFRELLESSMSLAGHELVILSNDPVSYSRIVAWLKSGKISLHWFLSTPDRGNQYIPIDVDITNGLIGHRVLLIRGENQPVFDAVKTAGDLNKNSLTAGFVRGLV